MLLQQICGQAVLAILTLASRSMLLLTTGCFNPSAWILSHYLKSHFQHSQTDALFGEKVVTVSAVHPLLKHILEEIVAVSSSDCSLVKEIKETTSDDLSARYVDGVLSEIIDKCSYLNPRLKTRYIQNKRRRLFKIKSEATVIANIIY